MSTAGFVLELGQVGEREPGLELFDALGGELAVGDPFGVGHQVLGEQLAARDLDPEIALEAEDDVQKVDRLGAQVALERGLAGHFVLVHAQGIHQRGLDFLEDLVVCRHSILKNKMGLPLQSQTATGSEAPKIKSPLLIVGEIVCRTSDGRTQGKVVARQAARGDVDLPALGAGIRHIS